jgi:benzodiazapine receptor
MYLSRFIKCSISLLLCVGGGLGMGLFTNQGVKTWYPQLTKSTLTPPSFVFPIAWTILYFLMGIALYLVWSSPKKNKTTALFVFFLQLFFNFIWSFIFFYKQNPFLALIDIVCLWLSIVVTILLFKRISKLGALLLIPYLLWVSFAFYLNFFIWMHN